MGKVVTGIAQTLDGNVLDEALREASLDPSRTSVLSREYDGDTFIGSDITVVDPGPEAVTNSRSQIITGGGGTGVPGITTGQRQEFFQPHRLFNLIADLAIPEAAVDNYVDAVDAGRAIVAYYAEDPEVPAAEQVFTQLGYRNVKTY